MINDRNVLILYATAVCNLKCTYCFIDKNPALVEIDNLLDESFSSDYYFDFCKQVFPDREQLTEIQIWGGEPTLNLRRVTPVIKKIVNYYPNITNLMFSTNLAHEKCLDEIYYLLESLKGDRNITLQLQLSLDGPTNIMDANRGSGTTKKFTENYIKLVQTIDSFLNKVPNISIQAFNKSTLNIENIEYLQEKDRIKDYYRFIEQFKEVSETVENPRFNFQPTVPNTACPLPITKDIGIKFANLCRLCRELEAEEDNFKYFKIITPYALEDYCRDTKFCNKGCCGSGKFCVGLLPNNLISTCHNGFTALLEEYRKFADLNQDSNLQGNFFKSGHAKNSMVFDYSGLSNYENQIEEFYNAESSSLVKTVLGQIQFLAFANQIDTKYKNVKEAVDATLFILNNCVNCIRDNLNITGTKTMVPANLLKLLLNGAKEYIENDR